MKKSILMAIFFSCTILPSAQKNHTTVILGGGLESKQGVQKLKKSLSLFGDQLLSAVKNNNRKKVADLIQKGADVWYVGKGGYSALMVAAQNNFYLILKDLLQSGALVNQRNEVGATALMIAAECGFLDCVKELLLAGSLINIASYKGVTPLMVAALNGHVSVCKLLLASGAEPNLVDRNGWNALMFAAFGINNRDPDYLERQIDTIKCLFDAGAWKNIQDMYGRTALVLAIENGKKEAGHFLIERGVLVNLITANGMTPLTIALEKNDDEMVEDLLSHGAEVNYSMSDGWTVLMEAARDGKINLVKKILSLGADVNRVNKYGASALILASPFGHRDVLEYLIAAGADTELLCDDPKIENGRLKALDYAINSKRDDVVRFLRDHFYKKIIEFYCEQRLHKKLDQDAAQSEKTDGESKKEECERERCIICLGEFESFPITLHATLASDGKTIAQHHRTCVNCTKEMLKHRNTRCPECRGGFICPWGLQKMVDWHKELDEKAWHEVNRLGDLCKEACGISEVDKAL